MSKYEGLYTFDVDNHRYIPVGQADGIIECFKFKHESKEPLIKDEKIRKAVRTWAEANGDTQIVYDEYCGFDNQLGDSISFVDGHKRLNYLSDHKIYTIDELCGEEEE